MTDGNDGQLQIIPDLLARLTEQPSPPTITPDQLAMGASGISQLSKILGVAANSGDPADIAAAENEYAERDAKTGDALTKFPASEEDSSAKLIGVGDQEMTQLVQQVPQIAAGLAGSISGALGGILQPLIQIPQQVAQVGQQAMQAGIGALQHGVGGDGAAGKEPFGTAGGAGEFGAGEFDDGGVGGGLAATTPTAMLGPLPAASAQTEPASSHTTSPGPPPASTSAPAPRGGAMGALPMMPPGAMHGAGGTGSDAKPDTKRVVAPAVKNGAPVQGRITTPPPTIEVTKRVEGKPIASRRILLPDYQRADDTDLSR